MPTDTFHGIRPLFFFLSNARYSKREEIYTDRVKVKCRVVFKRSFFFFFFHFPALPVLCYPTILSRV